MNQDFGSQLDAVMPKRRQRSDKGSPRSRTPTGQKISVTALKGNILSGLKAANSLAVNFIHGYAVYQLEPDEYEPLAKVIVSEIDASPRLQRLVMQTGNISAHGATFFVLLQMSMRRYAKYQMMKGNSNVGERNGEFVDSHTEPPVSMETGGTHGSDRGYGDRENLFNIYAPPLQDLHPESQIEVG